MNKRKFYKSDTAFIQFLKAYAENNATNSNKAKRELSEEKYYIGSFKESINKMFGYKLLDGLWIIYNCFENNKYVLYLKHVGNKSSLENFKFSRETEATGSYGLIGHKTLDQVLKKYEKPMKSSNSLSFQPDQNSANSLKSSEVDNVEEYIVGLKQIDLILNKNYTQSYFKNFVMNADFGITKSNICVYTSLQKGFVNSLILAPTSSMQDFKTDFDIINNPTKEKGKELSNITTSNSDLKSSQTVSSLSNHLKSEGLSTKVVKPSSGLKMEIANEPESLRVHKRSLPPKIEPNMMQEMKSPAMSSRLKIVIEYIKKNNDSIPIFTNVKNEKYFIGTYDEWKNRENYTYSLHNGKWHFHSIKIDSSKNDDKFIHPTSTNIFENLVYAECDSKHHPQFELLRNSTDNTYYFNSQSKLIEGTSFVETSRSGAFIFISKKKKELVSFLILPIAWLQTFILNEEKNKYKTIDIQLVKKIECANKRIDELIKKMYIERIKSVNIKQTQYWIGSTKRLIKFDSDNEYEFKLGTWLIFHSDILLVIHKDYDEELLELVGQTNKTENVGFADEKTISFLKKNRFAPKGATIFSQEEYEDNYKIYLADDSDGYVTCFALVPEKLIDKKISRSKDLKLVKHVPDTESSSD